MNKKNIVVLCGGESTERKISLATGKNIYHIIDRKKFNVKLIDTKKDLFKMISMAKNKKIDLVFLALHGKGGEDGTIQGLLDILRVKYTGSGVLASAIGMNKEITKLLLKMNKIKIPEFTVIGKEARNYKIMTFPFVLKPASHGSSIGVKIIKNKKELNKGLKDVFKIDNKAIAEEYIKGKEITVGVIGPNDSPKALPVVEISPKGQEFFNYKAKYSGETEEIVPARIDKNTARKAQDLALKVHKIIGCEDISRTDMILRNGEIFVLEINTIPGMTEKSILPKAAKAVGISFKKLVELFIKQGLKNG